jgi:16S rRNA pseudouridine516 synthase
MRIAQQLARLGYGSRREVESLLDAGRFSRAGGKIDARDAGSLETLEFDGEPIDPPGPLLLAMHKPVGYVCSRQDAGRLIGQLLPPRYSLRDPSLNSVGRLDSDTSGLLLLTDDGQLLHQLISPKKNVEKTYVAHLARPLKGHEAEVFARGDLLLNGETKPLKPATLLPIDATTAHIRICEGRYHQVRRMFAAVGNHVTHLSRIGIGNLWLRDLQLEQGTWRPLIEGERAALWQPPSI